MVNANMETESYEKLAFEEEGAYLDAVEARIDAIIERVAGKIAPLRGGLSGWHASDYEDIDRKRIAIRDLERYEEKQAEFAAYKPDPYFCHFELIIDGDGSREFCIGDSQHDLRDNEGAVVLGRWSPLRKVYINKNQTHFNIEVDGKAHTYDLRLRRMVQIRDATLVGVNTEFDSADVSLEGQVVDPFLVAVLKDKRRDYKLTDIVKTIQQNQNDILERPIDESFIVQGCAGSGKTMILLHRLSYLAFNHPEVDFSKYIVLTPNESFNKHIDELCDELDIGTITRLTVESYYVRLARRLSRNDVRSASGNDGHGGQAPKITVRADSVIPEFGLPVEYLTEVYSEAFLARIMELFGAIKRSSLEMIEAGSAGRLFLEKGIAAPDGDSLPYKAYLDVVRACSKAYRDSAALRDKVDAARRERDEVAAKLAEVSSAYGSASELLEPARVAVMDMATSLFESKKGELDVLRREVSNARAREKSARAVMESAAKKVDEAVRAHSDAESKLFSARNLSSQEITDADCRTNAEVVEMARNECAAEQAEVNRLQSELSEIGLFGFGRRMAVREELAQAEATLQAKFEKALERTANEHALRVRAERAEEVAIAEARLAKNAQSLTEAREAYAAAAERFERTRGERGELAISAERVKAEVDTLKRPVESFERDRYPNLAAIEELDALEALSPELANYAELCKELTPVQARYLHLGENRVRNLEERLEDAREALDEAERALRADVDEDALAEAELIGASLDASVFDKALGEEIASLRSRYGVAALDGKSYRHDLYLKALECVLYYGSLDDDKISICIDEAQDLSLAEHKLIRMAVGPSAALNLYGDTNQLVFPYKGVEAWTDLPEGIASNRYDLNENYRNTLQITEYCNERLGMDVAAIGLRGSAVSRLSLQAGIDELFALRGAKPGVRCAVLYKRGLAGVKDQLVELLGADAAYGRVDASKVSVIPVDAAKGLEFDAVVVIDNGMNGNERYLSFSRALDHLVVTHVKGATVEGDEEISSEGERSVGASKLKEAAIKASPPLAASVSDPEEPDADPFFDFDFS